MSVLTLSISMHQNLNFLEVLLPFCTLPVVDDEFQQGPFSRTQKLYHSSYFASICQAIRYQIRRCLHPPMDFGPIPRNEVHVPVPLECCDRLSSLVRDLILSNSGINLCSRQSSLLPSFLFLSGTVVSR
ncbi:hypothetical protein AVEN_103693-1 [Araneus ventricosus]|uniref:Uncharacterized protein n=1 Tax=Araneus ventricosus TaxID=182803 RepID=A0A4Y2RNQ0_ARAVE|nr:hypothetical protein AVEN_103693-1 [Araneus ventricosus]